MAQMKRQYISEMPETTSILLLVLKRRAPFGASARKTSMKAEERGVDMFLIFPFK